MNKTVKIDLVYECLSCGHLGDNLGACCHSEFKKPRKLKMGEYNEIPDWCPLPDAPKKEGE